MQTPAFREMRCEPCEGGIPAMTAAEVDEAVKALDDGWRVVDGQRAIERDLRFRDFAQALAFVNQVGAVAEAQGHHPDLHLHDWNRVRITLATHAIGGLSRNDFILAAHIDPLTATP